MAVLFASGKAVGRPPRDPASRLLACSVVRENGCREWTRSTFRDGYGQFRWGGKNWKAHRAAWVLWRGPIPDGAMLLHSCHNRRCIEPEHLRIGTHEENMKDRQAIGRYKTGVRLPQPIKEQIMALSQAGAGCRRVSAILGVPKSTVHNVIRAGAN